MTCKSPHSLYNALHPQQVSDKQTIFYGILGSPILRGLGFFCLGGTRISNWRYLSIPSFLYVKLFASFKAGKICVLELLKFFFPIIYELVAYPYMYEFYRGSHKDSNEGEDSNSLKFYWMTYSDLSIKNSLR